MSDSNTPKYTKGSISDISQNLYEELLTTGYSLLFSDIEGVILSEIKDYIAWNGELKSLEDKETDKLLPIDIDGETILTLDEWAIIEPVVIAHCDIMQAKRMEGVQNLGVQPVGMTASEAKQAYREVKLQMQKEAFDCEPYSVETTEKLAIKKRHQSFSKFWWW